MKITTKRLRQIIAEEIIKEQKEEYYLHMIEQYQSLLKEETRAAKRLARLSALYPDSRDPRVQRTKREPLLGQVSKGGLRAISDIAKLSLEWLKLINLQVDMRKVVDQARSEGLDVLAILTNIHKMIQDTYNKQGHGEYTPAPDEQKFIQSAPAMADKDYDFERRAQKNDSDRRKNLAKNLASSLSESIEIEIIDD